MEKMQGIEPDKPSVGLRLIVLAALSFFCVRLWLPLLPVFLPESIFAQEIRQSEACPGGGYAQQGYCPPVLASPGSANVTTSAADGTITIDRGDGIVYGCVTTSATPLDDAEIVSCTGGTAVSGDFSAVSSSGVQTLNASGLDASTNYYWQFVSFNPSGWPSNVSVSSSFTTGSPAPLATAWIGIPDPQTALSLNYNPLTITEPADPAEWPGAASTGNYYIDGGSGSCTDTSNTYGYPNQPRCTMVSATIGAGAKYVVVGDGEDYTGGNITITVSGTSNSAANLAWVVGRSNSTMSAANRPNLLNRRLTVTGNYYVVENFHLLWNTNQGILQVSGGYGIARNFEIEGDDTVLGGSGTAVGLSSNSIAYAGNVHNVGSWQTDSAADLHSFKITGDNVWVLDVTSTNVQGDCVQVGDAGTGSEPSTPSFPDKIYIGGLICTDTKENAVDIKDAFDVVISGGVFSGFNTDWGDDEGAAVVAHDDAQYVWVINTIMSNSTHGIVSSGDGGHTHSIGNLYYNITQSGGTGYFDPGTAISIRSGVGSSINDTFQNYRRAFEATVGASTVEVKNGIFASRDDSHGAESSDIAIENSSDYAAADIDYNLFTNFRGRNGGTNITTIGSWAHDENSQLGAVLFVDEANDDFTLQAGSPAVRNGAPTTPTAIALFASRYGFDLNVDIAGTNRPSDATDWDIGAYQREFSGFGSITNGAKSCPTSWSTYNVTSLSGGSGAGTFRDAVSQDCRYIQFTVGGNINLGNLQITKSYLTIDGSTAPSPGITLTNVGRLALEASGSVAVHDIIVKNIRAVGQGGETESNDLWELDGSSGAPIYNIVMDNLTLQDSGDGNFDVYGDVYDVTISNNLIFDSMQGHHFSESGGLRERISVFRNVYARLNERQPRVRYNTRQLDFVGNVIYGWGWYEAGAAGMHIDIASGTPSANVENNIYHYVSGLNGTENNALVVDSLLGNWHFNNNVWPAGETQGDSTSNSSRVSMVSSLTGLEFLPLRVVTDILSAGTHFPTSEESTLLQAIDTAVNGG